MNESLRNFIKEWVLPLIGAFVAAVIINNTLFFMARIPSSSMVPTIKKGDRIFVTKVYNTNNLKRGDIVLFKSEELGEVLVKRLIGLPGETVEIDSEGNVYINGNKLDEPYVKRTSDKTGTFKVPEDSFLFLGDNRADSLDSRYWDMPYISKKYIMGKARAIIYPFNRIRLLK